MLDDRTEVLTGPLPATVPPCPPPRSRQAAVAWAWINTFGTLALWTWALADAARALWGTG